MSQYVPWYFKRSCPIFCWPCVPVYTGIWPGRKFLLILGAVLFAIGLMMLLGLLLICVAVECSAVASPLIIFAFLLIVLGILFFHCGWAAHLLDYGGKVPDDEYTFGTNKKVTRFEDNNEAPKDEEPVFEEVKDQPQPEIKYGFWQFNERESWQAVANPYPIQHSLKPFVEREPYV
uniref:Uncharacterized protein n=1 Tax=Panagrolaimus sp. ES5 TaxID=591445 RepID=A0AC34FJ03_9BILA